MISSVKISTKLRANKTGLTSFLNLTNRQVISDIKKTTLTILRREAPARTFDLQRSIKVITDVNRSSGGETEQILRIGPTAKYTKFVLRGTRQSPGRYVATIEKRIKTGTHPGFPANPFVKRAKKLVNIEIKKIVEAKYGRVMIRRFLLAG